MSQNSEEIVQAKLCAYLEGELDEQGRAEIEKHLQQNPAHRRLLAEVGRTRELLRALPREPAPPDICEAFQGQLERSVLLSDLDDEAGASSMKINRWPQYLAVAAIVMLAAGLGMVVYFGLPSGAHDRNYAVTNSSATRGFNEDGAATNPVASETPVPSLKSEGTSDAYATRGTERGAASGGGMPGAYARVSASGPAPDELDKKKLAEGGPLQVTGVPGLSTTTAPAQDLTILAQRVQGSWETAERARLFGGLEAKESEAAAKVLESVPAGAMCYVVTSAQPATTSEKIGQELSKLQVAWSAVPQADPATIRMSLDTVRQQDHETSLAATEALNDNAATRGRAERPAPEAQVALRNGSTQDKSAAIEPNQATAGRAAATPPAAAAATAPAPDATAQSNATYALAPAVQPAPTPPATVRTASLIVARGLTQEQADALGTSFGARVLRRSVQPTTATSQPAGEAAAGAVAKQDDALAGNRKIAMARSAGDDPVIRQGDSLRLVMADAGGRPAVTELQVAPNGSVTVPGRGTFLCEGLTVGQFKTRLAESAGTGTSDAKSGDLIEVSKVDPARRDAAPPAAAAADMDVVAAVTEQDVARREARAKDEVLLRARNTPAQQPAQQPARRMAPTDRQPAERVAPGQPADAAAAAPAAPAPAPRPEGERRGGFGGGAVVMRQQSQAPAGGAGGGGGAGTDLNESSANQGTVAAPTTQADRFDVVFLVQSDAGGEAVAENAPGEPAEPAAEPKGPIEKFDILTVTLGEAEADSVNVRVGEDGTVELPKLGRVKAEGLTSDSLRREIADKLKPNATDADAAKVAVKRVGNAAGTEKAAPPTPATDK